jgi:hypothetical protein
MPQTILSHLLCLLNIQKTPFRDAVSRTAAQFDVPQSYVEQLFHKGLQ